VYSVNSITPLSFSGCESFPNTYAVTPILSAGTYRLRHTVSDMQGHISHLHTLVQRRPSNRAKKVRNVLV